MSNEADSSPVSTADRMPALAAEFVEACKKTGVNLDFLPRTLPLVDKLLHGKRAEIQQLAARHDPQAAALAAKHAPPIAAYLGEVSHSQGDRRDMV
jgi:hypothetical protein